MNLLFMPKVFPRQSVIGGPILIHHRIKNLSEMGYRITILAPASSDEDHTDKSLDAYCEDIVLIDSPRGRTPRQVKELEAKLKNSPPSSFQETVDTTHGLTRHSDLFWQETHMMRLSLNTQ